MLTQALLGVLNRSADASVVFTADRVSEIGQAYWGAYAVAKGGVQTLMKLLASELETNTPIGSTASIGPGPHRDDAEDLSGSRTGAMADSGNGAGRLSLPTGSRQQRRHRSDFPGPGSA